MTWITLIPLKSKAILLKITEAIRGRSSRQERPDKMNPWAATREANG